MSNIKLSYILTTYNKLNYLKITLPLLIAACKSDEEIIVVDGGSKDGTPGYIKDLYQQGKIHYCISEPDKGEAHGNNKGIFIAKGDLIKIISDDDIYDYNHIKLCKEYMLEHLDVDIVGASILQCQLADGGGQLYHFPNFDRDFKLWLSNKKKSIFFCGLSLIIRKSSIPYIGLFHTFFKNIDQEFVPRITALKANIHFYTRPLLISIVNKQSNSYNFSEQHEIEFIKSAFLYERFTSYLENREFFNPYSLKALSKHFLKELLFRFNSKNNIPGSILIDAVPQNKITSLDLTYKFLEDYLYSLKDFPETFLR